MRRAAVLWLLLFCLGLLAPAASPAAVTVLGATIGRSTLSEVQKSLPKGTRLERSPLIDAGYLEVPGSAFKDQTFKSVGYYFDAKDRLVGVALDQPAGIFEQVLNLFKERYTLVKDANPRDRSAVFRDGAVLIEVSVAPRGETMSLECALEPFMEALEMHRVSLEDPL